MLTVEIRSDDDGTSYLIVTHDNTIVRFESDPMEPEDTTFGRDLIWVKDAILEAYEFGLEDAREEE
jgi:hypothetical protein